MTNLIIVMAALIVVLSIWFVALCLEGKQLEKELDNVYEEYDRLVVDTGLNLSLTYSAYEALTETLHKKKVTKSEMGQAMQEAIGYLGTVLDDHREDEDETEDSNVSEETV